MAKTLANYDPLVQIPSGMTPAGADFPIVESHDILVGENDKRLDAKLDDIDNAIGNVGETPIATQLSSKVNTGDIVTSVAATGSTSNNKIPSETAVRAAIEAKTINVDSTVTEGSTNAVSGGAVHAQLATKQDVLTFDTTPTASSSNPVTSGGVKAALDTQLATKQDALTFDTTPTASSNNPVTSGGVKAALDGKQNVLTYETTPVVGSVNPVTSTGIRNAIDAAAASNLGDMRAQYAEFVADADDILEHAKSLSNGMVACSDISAETTVGDTRILLYTGTTNSKYTNGHWYYNSAPSNAAPSWTDGGAVGSAPTIDNTLTTAGAAADSKSVGDAIENIVTISDTQPGSNSGNKVWIKETTNEEVQVPTYEEHIAKANKADIATNNESDNGSGTITASKKYAIGDHFYINNTNTSSENYGVSTLYKATAAIASGSAIVVGTNCEASKVADEITSLSNDIDTVNESLGDVKADLTGFSKVCTYTGVGTKQFPIYLFNGQTYSITNNTNNQMTVKAVNTLGTSVNVIEGLKVGDTYVWTPTEDYVSIGGFSSSAGTLVITYGGIVSYAEELFFGEKINLVQGSITSTSQPPVLTYANYRLRPDRFIRVKAGHSVKITNGSFRHSFFGWYGTDPNTAVRTIVSGVVTTDGLYYFEQDGFFSVYFNKNPESVITPEQFDGSIEIGLYQTKTIRVMSYNTGGFEGAGYTQGSDALALEYRKAIGETGANLCILQEDLPYFNASTQSNPKDAIFGMYRYNTRNGGTNYNYKCFASDYPIMNRTAVDYQTADTNHYYFLVGEIAVNGETITIVNLHLDWYDVTRRHSQIAEVIAYLNGRKRAIIGGDMNPSVRINGEFPEGTSQNENYDHWEEDNALWEAAGYTVGNGGYFGAYQTDLTYPEPTSTDCAAWDNIIVSNDIKIKNVGVTKAAYMNDHAIFYADLEIEQID